MSVARYYTNVNSQRPKEYWDDSLYVEWGDAQDYDLLRTLGRGTYSQVFEGLDRNNNQRCVVKTLKLGVPQHKVDKEIKVLQNLFGGPNIVKLLDIVRDKKHQIPSLIFEYVNSTDHKQLYPTLTDIDVRHYMYELLRALDYCHSQGIMHRDLKPSNVVIDHAQRSLRLIDLGLAEFYHPYRDYSIRVATRWYRAPELLVNFRQYDYSLDMWSLDCIFAEMIFRREALFRGSNNNDQLVQIAKVLGTDELGSYLDKYHIGLFRWVRGYHKKPWTNFVNADNWNLAGEDAVHLMSKLLRYDHEERISAAEAMAHRYFDPVRSA